MIKLDDIQKAGFKVTWKVIDIGFKGSKVFRGELSARDIIDYALLQLESGKADKTSGELACEYDTNTEEVDNLVKGLANKENTDYSIEFRKWRVLYVEKEFPTEKTDYINGLIMLGNIWVALDFPEDSPHVFQGRGNDITPEQYYTEENYKELFHKHKEWIEKEVKQLTDSDKKNMTP